MNENEKSKQGKKKKGVNVGWLIRTGGKRRKKKKRNRNTTRMFSSGGADLCGERERERGRARKPPPPDRISPRKGGKGKNADPKQLGKNRSRTFTQGATRNSQNNTYSRWSSAQNFPEVKPWQIEFLLNCWHKKQEYEELNFQKKRTPQKHIGRQTDFLKGNTRSEKHIFQENLTTHYSINQSRKKKKNKGVTGPMGHPEELGRHLRGGEHRGAETPPLSQPPKKQNNTYRQTQTFYPNYCPDASPAC